MKYLQDPATNFSYYSYQDPERDSRANLRRSILSKDEIISKAS